MKYLELKGGLVDGPTGPAGFVNNKCTKDSSFELCRLFDELEKTLVNNLSELSCIGKDYMKLSNDQDFLDNLVKFYASIQIQKTIFQKQLSQEDNYSDIYVKNYMNVIHELFYGTYLFNSFYKLKIIKHSKKKISRTIPCDTTIDINSFQLFIGQKLTKILLLLINIKKNTNDPSFITLLNNDINYCDYLIKKMI